MVDPVLQQPQAGSGQVPSSAPTLVLGLSPTILAPYVMQAIALIGMIVFVIARDGVTTQQIITVLAAVGGGNALVGGAVTIAAHLAGARVGAATATANPSNGAGTPASGPAAGA